MLTRPCPNRRLLPFVGLAVALITTLATACSSDGPGERAAEASPTSSDGGGSTATDLTYARNPAAAIEKARAASASDQRPVLLDFGADWCIDCVVLDRLYQEPAVASILADDFHLVKIDVGEWDKNLDVAAEYIDLDTSGIPGLVVLTPGGTVAYASNGGEFATARDMDTGQLTEFLKRWADPT